MARQRERRGLAKIGYNIDDAVRDARFSISSPIHSVISGVCSAGFKIDTLPQANAGAIFHASIAIGPFYGMIWLHTPTGSRSV